MRISKHSLATHALAWAVMLVLTLTPLSAQKKLTDDMIVDQVRIRLADDPDVGGLQIDVDDDHADVSSMVPVPDDELPVRACEVAWRSDGQELAVMQPDGLCSPTATGTVVGIDLSNPRTPTTLATQAAHPQWQPVANGG